MEKRQERMEHVVVHLNLQTSYGRDNLKNGWLLSCRKHFLQGKTQERYRYNNKRSSIRPQEHASHLTLAIDQPPYLTKLLFNNRANSNAGARTAWTLSCYLLRSSLLSNPRKTSLLPSIVGARLFHCRPWTRVFFAPTPRTGRPFLRRASLLASRKRRGRLCSIRPWVLFP